MTNYKIQSPNECQNQNVKANMPPSVIPAKAGIQCLLRVTLDPASLQRRAGKCGMTFSHLKLI